MDIMTKVYFSYVQVMFFNENKTPSLIKVNLPKHKNGTKKFYGEMAKLKNPQVEGYRLMEVSRVKAYVDLPFEVLERGFVND
ncbi:MAG: hypothetical protein [Podoviridae sp. ctjc_2]|nr:MAG: hypothetical protein [Podoviridae sp. ctjc_2]